jgi:3-dehydroquinate synthase
MMESVDVKSSSGAYSFTAGSSILEKKLADLKKRRKFDTCFLLVDENVWNHHKSFITKSFESAGFEYRVRIIPAGETSKSIHRWNELLDYLLDSGVRRNTPVFAIGGGVAGDLCGFAAASVMRGIPLIHLPTTLLAMVDSSIGGKTGVNHPAGKNLVGAFYQPVEVIAEIDFLHTLPGREWANGLSEILKYGAIRDAGIFDDAAFFLNDENPVQNSAALAALILKCAKIKADIVEEDEFEAGVRAHLNFGHTFAHAMEKAAGFGNLNHGEAVYLGMLAAISLSNLEGADLDDEPLRRFRKLYSFRVKGDSLNTDELLQSMKLDKKVVDENYRFVLLQDWQQPIVKPVTNVGLINKAWLTVINELS